MELKTTALGYNTFTNIQGGACTINVINVDRKCMENPIVSKVAKLPGS